MQSQIIPKKFIVGSREDYILKNGLEGISTLEEENVDFTVKSTQSIPPISTPLNTPCSPRDALQDPEDTHKHQQDCSEIEESLQSSSNKPTSSMKSQSSMESASFKLLEHWKAVAIDSQNKIQMLKARIIEVEAQNENLIDARSRREMMTRDPTETIFYGLLQQNWQQAQAIQHLEKHACLLTTDGEVDVRLSLKQMNALMEKMKAALDSVMHKNGISLRTTLNTTKFNFDLQNLLDLLFGVETNVELDGAMKNLDPQLLLRGLALAAVRQWIFMTNFPGFEENRLSTARIKVMLQKYDWKCARKLAIASYLSIIRDPSFTGRYLYEQTQNLVMRFSRALAPLCNPPYDSEKILSDIWVDSEGTIGRLFKIALIFKAGTVATKQQYEFVVYPPGTTEAKTTPVVEKFAVPKQPEKDLTYEVWKHASLYVYEVESTLKSNELADAMVKSNNFTLQDAGVRDEKCCLNSVMTISKEFDESHWNTDEDVDTVSITGIAENKASSKIAQKKKIDVVVGDATVSVNQSESIAKMDLQSSVEAPIDNQSGKNFHETSGQLSEITTKLSYSCLVCLNVFSAKVFEGHLKNKPAWCQPPCSVCGGKYYEKSSIAKHKRHGKKDNTVVLELGSGKRGKAPGLDLLAEAARKEIDVTSVAKVTEEKEKKEQKASEKSPERPHRRSTRLNTQDEIAAEAKDDKALRVEDVNIGDTSRADKTGELPASPESHKCGNCGIVYKNACSATRHKNARACKKCPDCGNWFGSAKSFKRHQCKVSGSLEKPKGKYIKALYDDWNTQKVKTPDCDKTVLKSNGISEHQTPAATKQMSSRSSEHPEVNLEVPNDDNTESEADPTCSQAESPLSDEGTKSPIPSAIPAGVSLKRSRPSENQDLEKRQIQGGDSVTEEAERTWPSRLNIMQETAMKQNCPRLSDQEEATFNFNHIQPLNPSSQLSNFEFEKWQNFTPQESNAAGPRNDCIAFDSQSDTFSGLLGGFQHSFSIPQGFNGEGSGFLSTTEAQFNGSQHPVSSGQLSAYEGYHTAASSRQPQGLMHPLTAQAIMEGEFSSPQRKYRNAIPGTLSVDFLDAEGVDYSY
ncbi:hypothetical protein DSL72_002666 [Monilinia vaccinii-corymbosi]|uniref:C2H2-type domain-containing protein n=1 Tax=Monilinia vaccinii-corymbosi TaxID=61207 RepID=A0A8A3PDD4_9HELO|nr:hypothetical protein DSL72_002666 [Monilinia vaccinii-corymbosi]